MRRRLLLALILAGCGGGEAAPPDARPPDARPTIDAPPDAPRPDARLAACGIEEPGSRCAAADRVERCDGTEVVSETCGGGRVCGVDPATASGAACVEAGGECGVIDLPVCSGVVLGSCGVDDRLRLIDCSALFAACTMNAAGTLGACSTECTDSRTTAEGVCVEGGLRHCVFEDGVYRVVVDACPEGTICTPTGSSVGLPGCATALACGGVGTFGACDGATLRRCAGGQLETTDCAATGAVCAWAGDAHACVPAGSAGARAVSGIATYDDRKPFFNGLEPPAPRPVRGAGVVVIDDASGLALASGGTADDGSFSLRFDAAEGAPVRLVLVAAGVDAGRPVRVMRPDGLLLGASSPSFPAAADARVDVHVGEVGGAEAFNILDVVIAALDAVRTLFAVAEPPPLFVVYAKGGSSIDLSLVSGNLLRVLGTIEDDDGYDDAVLAHEFGHYVENNIGATDNPGGRHSFRFPSPPPLAWSEGFASYFGGIVRGDPIYIDTNLAGGLTFDLEEDVTPAVSDDQSANLPENTVAELLWDLGDAPDDDDDPSSGPQAAVVRVEDLYFRASPADRGAQAIDLVDFLDGYLLLQGADRCAELRAVLATRDFPYDFAGAVSCPLP
jgi:hypothetical protein